MSTITSETMTLYRVFSNTGLQVGQWLTPTLPTSSAEAISSLALPGLNAATYYSTVTIPAGTAIQIGTAAGTFGQIGGGLQIYLLQAPDASWFSEPVMIGQ